MGLDEDAVDLFEVHDAGLVANGFDEGSQTEIAGAAQETFTGADDERQRIGREGIVAQAGAIQLVHDKLLDGFGSQAGEEGRVSDAGADFLVDGQGQGLQQRRLADEDQVVRAGKVFAQEPEFAEAVRRHEMGVINDGNQHLAGAVDAEGLLHEQAFAVMVAALKLDLKGFAEDAERVVIGVQRAVDDGRDHAFGVVRQERLFQNTFAGARFAEHQTEAALLGVNPENVKDFLLVGQQCDGFRVEGIALQAKMGADHKLNFGWRVERFAVVGEGVEQTGFAHAFALVINHHATHRLRTLKADVNGAVGQVAWPFKAKRFK